MARVQGRSAEQWREILVGLAASGLTQKAYAAQVGCHPSNFGWWRKRLQEIDAQDNGPSSRPFVELRASATSPEPAECLSFAVRINGSNGMAATFATLPPVEYVAALLRAG